MAHRFIETEKGHTILVQKISVIENYDVLTVVMDNGRKIQITERDKRDIQHMLLDELLNG